jgi:hypothetical protein
MTDDQRKAIRDSAHQLRSRLTFIMLCSHTLKLDLHDALSLKHEEEFHKMDIVLEETKAVLNTLLRQCEQLRQKPLSKLGAMLGSSAPDRNPRSPFNDFSIEQDDSVLALPRLRPLISP